MKVHITNLYGHAPSSTAMLSQQMVTTVAKEMGFHELSIFGFPSYVEEAHLMEVRMDGIMSGISEDDIVIFQFPTWNVVEYDLLFFQKLKRYRYLKIVIFIHDMIPLMFESNYYVMEKYMPMFNQADALILPSANMHARLVQEGLTNTNIILQEMWDHCTNIQCHTPSFKRQLYFLGNINRFPFVKNWQLSIPLHLFGVDTNSVKAPNVHVSDWQNDDSLLLNLSTGGVGLVWSEKIDNQDERVYSTMNVSYKLSTYLAAGIPVIVNRGISNQHIIEQNQLGFVADSLDEVQDMMMQLNEDTYQQLLKNTKPFSFLLRQGYFTRKALVASIHAILKK